MPMMRIGGTVCVIDSRAASMKRLQSEVEVGAALDALVERVDLIDTGIRVALKLPNSSTDEEYREIRTR
jgi:hypothetical protein